jgi:hypothetical protein
MFRVTKLYRINGSIIGFCGLNEHALKFIEWRRTPDAKPTFSDSSCFSALELTIDGRILYWGGEMMAVEVEEEFYGIGSGAPYALGAMARGASLKEAVKIAGRWDEATGSEIQTMTLRSHA